MKPLYERLNYEIATDFLKLSKAYLQDDSNDYVRNIRRHFELVINNDPRYLNHRSVLALSIGGSNTKVMISSTHNGLLHIHHIRTIKNPAEVMHFYDFMDELIIKDKAVYSYICESERPSMSIVLPVMIGPDGIPQHPKKIPTITGMLARNEADMVSELNLDNNTRRYFESRNLPQPLLYYQPDPVIAHLGGVSQIELKPGERTFLLVCGTGMATADDNTSRTLSRTPIMDHDEGLYPAEQTEGYLYESGCSGLLLHGVMRRAIQIRECEEGSKLKGLNAYRFFQTSDDSVLICRIWESTFDSNLSNARVAKIKASMPAEAFYELQRIATLLMDRLHGTLASAIVATAVKITRREGASPYHVIFEGSVALNHYSVPLIMQGVYDLLKRDELYALLEVEKPVIDLFFRPHKRIIRDSSVMSEECNKMDLSLIGTAVSAITNDILRNN